MSLREFGEKWLKNIGPTLLNFNGRISFVAGIYLIGWLCRIVQRAKKKAFSFGAFTGSETFAGALWEPESAQVISLSWSLRLGARPDSPKTEAKDPESWSVSASNSSQ